jgi:hypothetical protein
MAKTDELMSKLYTFYSSSPTLLRKKSVGRFLQANLIFAGNSERQPIKGFTTNGAHFTLLHCLQI